MKIKFNRYEQVAGLFVMTAIIGSCTAMIGVAIKKGWFEPKVSFSTSLHNAEGVREGTLVQMAGLRAGSVSRVELREGSNQSNEIFIQLDISEKFRDRVREDSVVHAVRPFIIGEKVIDITVGSAHMALLPVGALIRSEASADVMDLMSGRSLGPYIETVGRMMENLKTVAEAILDPQRSKAIVQIFDQISPLVKNATGVSREAAVFLHDVNKDKRMSRVIANLATMTDDLARLMPMIEKDSPELAIDMKKIARNTAVLTEELTKTLPMLEKMAPEFPRASVRAMEALDETVVTLKALQKSFLLRGNVHDVKEEEALREQRMPASESK